MSAGWWIGAFAILIIILIVAFGIGWGVRNNPGHPPAVTNRFNTVSLWGPNTPIPDSDKSTCQLYTFTTQIINQLAVPGTPTLNSQILDSLDGTTPFPKCLDTDQIVAQKTQHTCQLGTGASPGDNSISRCLLSTGGVTGPGGSEVFYTPSGCPALKACAGQLSLVAVNFQSPFQGPTGDPGPVYCIESNGTDSAIVNPCDPSNPNQLFRITRIQPGQDPNSLKPGQGQQGIIAQILDRTSGLCLTMGDSSATSIYDASYLGVPQCTGTDIISGTNVVLGPCVEGPTGAPGYEWLMMPSVPYCSNPEGCFGCTGSGCSQDAPCQRQPLSNACNGNCTDFCIGSANMITPPQIVYLGNLLNLDTYPDQNGYQGLTGSSALIKWMLDNSATSLYFGGTGNGLILAPLGVDVEVCEQQPYKAQYANLSLYNIIINQSVCLAEGQNPNCTPL